MPDAFIIDENFNFNDNPNTHIPHFVDTDLTEFLASCWCDFPSIYPIYLKDSLVDNDSNFYFGFGEMQPYILKHYKSFGTSNFDDISDASYNGSLDLSKYAYLFKKPSV